MTDCNSCKQMALDEAIAHANETADSLMANCETHQCGSEHRQLAKWLEELKLLKNQYTYLAADFANYKKRTEANNAVIAINVKKDFAKKLLDVYDEFARADKYVCDSEKLGIPKTAHEHGFQLAFEKLDTFLKNEGFKKLVCSYGDKLNVAEMDAIAVRDIRPDEGYDPDDVVEICKFGWKLEDQNGTIIVRPAQVVVGK